MLCSQTSSSRSAGAAALSRYENETTGPQGQRPTSASCSGKVSRVEAGMLTQAKREIDKEKASQVATDTLEIKVAKKLAINDTPEAVVTAGGYARVLVDCPVTGAFLLTVYLMVYQMTVMLYAYLSISGTRDIIVEILLRCLKTQN